MNNFDSLRELLNIVKEYSDDIDPDVISTAINVTCKEDIGATVASMYGTLARNLNNDTSSCACKEQK